MRNIRDLYTDYLLSSFGQVTSTGLSSVLEGSLSHDKITRYLSKHRNSGKELWLLVKSFVKKYKTEDACLIFDDTIIEKAYSNCNSYNCWHWDHSKGKNVKGLNLLNCLYHSETKENYIRVPVGYELITKPIHYSEIATKKEKRKSTISKNELFRTMVSQNIRNQLPFQYILADSWFCSNDNMKFIDKKKKTFIFDVKTNRLAAQQTGLRNKGQWTRIDQMDFTKDIPKEVYLKGLEIKVLIVKQVFTNKDKSVGVRYLVSNNLSLTGVKFMTLYKKRWSVEEYHKSLKQNSSIGKSPASTKNTQLSHVFHSILAYVKLEKIRLNTNHNHFAMKAKIYLAAVKAAYQELNKIKGIDVNYQFA